LFPLKPQTYSNPACLDFGPEVNLQNTNFTNRINLIIRKEGLLRLWKTLKKKEGCAVMSTKK
jgi:hypothetical protein